MPSIVAHVNQLGADISARRKSLEDALFDLQAWLEANAVTLTSADRGEFSRVLVAEKASPDAETAGKSNDSALVLSVLRLHAMRLLFRQDAASADPLKPADASAYERGKLVLKVALREVETAVNEARIDVAIANAHHILGDRGANRRWLQDALIRVQTVASKDLVKLATAIPAPDAPALSWLQKLLLRFYGIRQEEIARRTLASLRDLAQLQNSQMAEMATLLAESFDTAGDRLGAQQALAILAALSAKAGEKVTPPS